MYGPQLAYRRAVPTCSACGVESRSSFPGYERLSSFKDQIIPKNPTYCNLQLLLLPSPMPSIVVNNCLLQLVVQLVYLSPTLLVTCPLRVLGVDCLESVVCRQCVMQPFSFSKRQPSCLLSDITIGAASIPHRLPNLSIKA